MSSGSAFQVFHAKPLPKNLELVSQPEFEKLGNAAGFVS